MMTSVNSCLSKLVIRSLNRIGVGNIGIARGTSFDFTNVKQKAFKWLVFTTDITPGFPTLHDHPHLLALSAIEKSGITGTSRTTKNLELHGYSRLLLEVKLARLLRWPGPYEEMYLL